MPMIIHHLHAAHPGYYHSINTDFGKSGVESIVKWLTLRHASWSSNFACHKCGNRPFQSTSSSLTGSHCIACWSRGFRVIIYRSSQYASYLPDRVEQTAHMTEKYDIDTVSERVTLHTTLSGFPAGTVAAEVSVCFQCRVLIDNISDIEGHLRHSPVHETDVIAQLEMHGRSGLQYMLPMMFIVSGDYVTDENSEDYVTDANSGDGNPEDELVRDDGQGRHIKKRRKISNTLPDIQTGKGSDSEISFDGEFIFVAGSLGKMVQPAFDYTVGSNSNMMTGKRKRSASFASNAREHPTVMKIRLIDFNSSIDIKNPITFATLTNHIMENIDDYMRLRFRGLTGSKKPPAWTEFSDNAWNSMWDEDVWKSLKSRGEKESFIPTVDVEILWGFGTA
ncbi:hypothetical protein Q9L58_004067 [Maublancomyces gigas]|uniref:C2H2-type domain-containing protein n=1 Tax=Discina gigas TaxID=1032678 RepID=A0ABR3GM27_9PEZI